MCENKDMSEKDCGVVDGTEYRSIVGKLNYLASTTLPDLMFAVSFLSQFNRCPHREHLMALKHVVQYLNGTKRRGIKYERIREGMITFSDANWAQCSNDRILDV